MEKDLLHLILEEEPEDYEEYGYCRTSTAKQNIDRQVRNILRVHPDARIVKETFTGTKIAGRKEWERLYNQVEKRSKVKRVRITFDSVSRFSRNADEGCELYEELFRKNIELAFLQEPHIDTAVYKKALQNQIRIRLDTGNKATDDLINSIVEALNKYTMELAKEQIRIAFEQAEKEVKDLHQRTKEGIETARINGKQIGQKTGAKLNVKKAVKAKVDIMKYSKDFGGTLNDIDTMKLVGVSRNTYYKYKKELAEA